MYSHDVHFKDLVPPRSSPSYPFGTYVSQQSPADGVVNRDLSTGRASQPVEMWLQALDVMCADLKATCGTTYLPHVVGVSCSAQQHGSVWWKEEGERALKRLDERTAELWRDANDAKAKAGGNQEEEEDKGEEDKRLQPPAFVDLVEMDSFSRRESPIWLDHSTSKQLHQLQNSDPSIPNPLRMGEITGSAGCHRFTASQIMKIMQEENAETYVKTHRIHLISTFLTSLFIGSMRATPFDLTDACGMNMLGIFTSRDWDPRILNVMCGGDVAEVVALRQKLGPKKPVPSETVVGKASAFLKYKLGINAQQDINVVSCTGDNPSTVAGLGLTKGDVIISLGTSDTMMGVTSSPQINEYSHFFVDPTSSSSDSYVGMLCASNGGYIRTDLCNAYCGGSWTEFNNLLLQSPPGNNEKIAIHVKTPETVPPISVCGVYRYDLRKSRRLAPGEMFASPATEVRACVESRLMSLRLRGASCNILASSQTSAAGYGDSDLAAGMGGTRRVIVTGGGAGSDQILQVIADVFNAPVFISGGDGAVQSGSALGAALRAVHGSLLGAARIGASNASDHISYLDICGGLIPLLYKASPDAVSAAVYDEIIAGFDEFECEVVSESEQIANKQMRRAAIFGATRKEVATNPEPHSPGGRLSPNISPPGIGGGVGGVGGLVSARSSANSNASRGSSNSNSGVGEGGGEGGDSSDAQKLMAASEEERKKYAARKKIEENWRIEEESEGAGNESGREGEGFFDNLGFYVGVGVVCTLAGALYFRSALFASGAALSSKR